jgi:hypothetical protein
MAWHRRLVVAATWVAGAVPAGATDVAAPWGEPGRLVQVAVEVEGTRTPLYPAPDGSGRFYLEAVAGRTYTLRLQNRTGERLAASVAVDGLNVVSGEPETGRGRMYVLDPWEATTIRGWRTSLQDVQRFVFVDERGSYAVRSGKPTRRLGWIELQVYRERRRFRPPVCCDYEPRPHPAPAGEPFLEGRERKADGDTAQSAAPPATVAPMPRDEAETQAGGAGEPKEQARSADAVGKDARAPRRSAPPAARSFPGTGWGQHASDPVTVVSFDAEAEPAERVTLRYEYAAGLRALGIHPWPESARDRLLERERGDTGFAKPPSR